MRDYLETLSWYYHRAELFAFTRRHSLEFDGFIPRDKLVAESAESLANSNNYRPYSNFHLKLLLREALKSGILHICQEVFRLPERLWCGFLRTSD